jgi:hypothetical protein
MTSARRRKTAFVPRSVLRATLTGDGGHREAGRESGLPESGVADISFSDVGKDGLGVAADAFGGD